VHLNTTAQQEVNLSLEEALALAKNGNIDISISNAQVDAANYAVKEAKGSVLPKLSADASYNRNIDRQVIFLPEAFGMAGSATELGFDNDYRASLNLSLPIFSKANKSLQKIAQSQLLLQQETGRGIEQVVVSDIKNAYFTVLLLQEVVAVQQNRLANVLKIQTDIEKRLKQGQVTEYDLTAAQVQVATAQANLLEAQSNILPATNTLKLLIGIDTTIKLNLTAPLEIVENELLRSEALNEMLNNNSQLKQLELEAQISENQLEATSAAYYPTLNAIGNYSYLAQADDFDISEYDWVQTSLVGLQLQIPIFNGNITKNRVAQAKIAKDITLERQQFAETQLSMQYNELRQNLQFSMERTEVQKTNMKLSEKALQLAQKRYQFGAGTFLEVNDAELTYTQARLNWLQAVSDYKTTFYNYQLLLGND
jgi:outer membrane protein TolC|tara:strand:+ start:34292 stop:35566 length:1275 start_codon:yes stop_codon:yes gene_type:complete